MPRLRLKLRHRIHLRRLYVDEQHPQQLGHLRRARVAMREHEADVRDDHLWVQRMWS